MIVDCKNFKLVDNISKQVASVKPSNIIMNISCKNPSIPPKVQEIIDKFPNLTNPQKKEDAAVPKVYHRIETGSNPQYSPKLDSYQKQNLT